MNNGFEVGIVYLWLGVFDHGDFNGVLFISIQSHFQGALGFFWKIREIRFYAKIGV